MAIDALRPKLRPDGIIVSLSPYRAGVAALADYVIPGPAFAESFDEAPTPWDAAVASYATAPALLELPAGAIHPLEFLNRVTGGEDSVEGLIRARVGEISMAKRGEVFTFADRTQKAVVDFQSSDELWKAFAAGACWTDRGATATPVAMGQGAGKASAPIVMSARPAIALPLFTKIDQESRIGRA